MDTNTTQEPAIIEGRKFKFNFKTTEKVITDADGQEISRAKVEPHPSIETVLPVPSAADCIAYLGCLNETEYVGDKQVPTVRAKVARMLMESAYDNISSAARSQINDWLERAPEGARFTPNNFDLNKLTLEYIACLEPRARGAWSPSDAELQSFCKDYASVYINEIRYEAKRVKVHCDQFLKGFSKVRNDKIALGKLKDFLVNFAANASEQMMSEQEATFGWLMDRINRYMNAEERNVADAL